MCCVRRSFVWRTWFFFSFRFRSKQRMVEKERNGKNIIFQVILFLLSSCVLFQCQGFRRQLNDDDYNWNFFLPCFTKWCWLIICRISDEFSLSCNVEWCGGGLRSLRYAFNRLAFVVDWLCTGRIRSLAMFLRIVFATFCTWDDDWWSCAWNLATMLFVIG